MILHVVVQAQFLLEGYMILVIRQAHTIDTSVSDYKFDYKTVGDEFADRAGTLYNYNPTNHYQRPQDKVNAGFFAKYA